MKNSICGNWGGGIARGSKKRANRPKGDDKFTTQSIFQKTSSRVPHEVHKKKGGGDRCKQPEVKRKEQRAVKEKNASLSKSSLKTLK